jgi:dipeptidase D
LLNLDSEDEGVFTVGCAGGKDTRIVFDVNREDFKGNVFELKVGGLLGGHSGVDVDSGRGNANIILARLLNKLLLNFDLRIVSINGGSAHNAIPRDAVAVVAVNDDISKAVLDFEKVVKNELHQIEKNLFISLNESSMNFKPLTEDSTKRFVDFMLAMPNGVAGMSLDIDGLVETSNNFATIKTSQNGFEILSSQRSSVMSKLDWITKKIESVAKLSGARFESGNGYPSWEPNMNSNVLKRCKNVYKEIFDKEPIVETIHAGLECGIIGAKNEGMEMISFGPTIVAPHSPDEKMNISSLEKTLEFTVKLLESYCK